MAIVNRQPCSRVGCSSVGVSPSLWMGTFGKKDGGFSKNPKRNTAKISPRDEREMQKIRANMLAQQHAKRAVMKQYQADISGLSERLQRRLKS